MWWGRNHEREREGRSYWPLWGLTWPPTATTVIWYYIYDITFQGIYSTSNGYNYYFMFRDCRQRASYPVEDEVHELTAAFGEVSLVPPGSPINQTRTQTLSAPLWRSRNGWRRLFDSCRAWWIGKSWIQPSWICNTNIYWARIGAQIKNSSSNNNNSKATKLHNFVIYIGKLGPNNWVIK